MRSDCISSSIVSISVWTDSCGAKVELERFSETAGGENVETRGNEAGVAEIEGKVSTAGSSGRVAIELAGERTGDVARVKCTGARKVHCAASKIAAKGCAKRSGN